MNRTRRQAGFSLLEVMCALGILGIGLLGLTQALTTALRATRDSEIRTAAALFAAGLLETLRAEGFITNGETEGDCGTELKDCQWRQTITGAGIDGLHDVTVAIEQAKTGKALFELRTLLFEPPTALSSNGADRRGDARSRDRRSTP